MGFDVAGKLRGELEARDGEQIGPGAIRIGPGDRHLEVARSGAQVRCTLHDGPPVSGHRQIAVVRHGPVTIIQFVFESGGLLPEHRAEGVVTIHVLSGRLQVVVDGADPPVGLVNVIVEAAPQPPGLSTQKAMTDRNGEALVAIAGAPPVLPDGGPAGLTRDFNPAQAHTNLRLECIATGFVGS